MDHRSIVAEAEKAGIESAGGQVDIYQCVHSSLMNCQNFVTRLSQIESQRLFPLRSLLRCMPLPNPIIRSSMLKSFQPTMHSCLAFPPVTVTSLHNGRCVLSVTLSIPQTMSEQTSTHRRSGTPPAASGHLEVCTGSTLESSSRLLVTEEAKNRQLSHPCLHSPTTESFMFRSVMRKHSAS
jgi:hypothetical protein